MLDFVSAETTTKVDDFLQKEMLMACASAKGDKSNQKSDGIGAISSRVKTFISEMRTLIPSSADENSYQ